MTTIKKTIFGLFFILLAGNISAQHKIGYLELDSIIKDMPEYAEASKVLEKLGNDLSARYNLMVSEYQNKESDCAKQQNNPNISPSIKELCLDELEDQQKRIQAFQQKAQKDISDKQNELVAPIIDKVKKIIADIAKEKGYAYVMDSAQSGFLYSSPADDLTAEVKKRLNLK